MKNTTSSGSTSSKISRVPSTVAEKPIKAALKIDAAVTENPSRYVKDNLNCYTVAINTWLLVMRELAPSNELHNLWDDLFIRDISERGLVQMIDAANKCATVIIALGNLRESFPEGCPRSLEVWLFAHTSLRTAPVLQALRFLKRFSPMHTEHLHKEIETNFKKLENKLYLNDRRMFADRGFPDYYHVPGVTQATSREAQLIDALRDIVETYLVGYQAPQVDDEYFSSGAINDGVTTTTGKVLATLSKEADIPRVTGQYGPLICNLANLGKMQPYTWRTRWTTVPKSYKTRRPIAVEEAGRQYHMQGVRTALERCLSVNTNITLDDQSQNQHLAKVGSAGPIKIGADTRLATIDLSAASDHISLGLVRAIFPTSVVDDLERYRARYVEFPSGAVRELAKFSTSGSALCFVVETIVFHAIAEAAVRWSAMLLGFADDDLDKALWYTRSYGDDIIVPGWAAITTIEFLELLGFEVNRDKSFISEDEAYRESCGEEYVDGIEITSAYWPRKELAISHQDVASYLSLVELQHRLYVHECIYTNEYLVSVIKWIYPSVTESFVDSPYTDVWRDTPSILVASRADSEPLFRDVEKHTIVKDEYQGKTDAITEILAYVQWLRNGSMLSDEPFDRLLQASGVRIFKPCDHRSIGTVGRQVIRNKRF